MTSPAQDAAAILVSAGVGVLGAPSGATGWRIMVGRHVDLPDQQIALVDTGGSNSNPAFLLDEVSLQALVRGPKDRYDLGWQKAKDVKDVLLGRDPQDLTTSRWDGVTALGDITYMGADDNNRPLFSMNFRIFVEPNTAALGSRVPL
jgi:hypothetical protein